MSDYARLKQHYGEWMTVGDIQDELKVKHLSKQVLYGMKYKLRNRKDAPTRKERIYSSFDVAKFIDDRRAIRDTRLCKTCEFSGFSSAGTVYCDYATKVGITKHTLKKRGMTNALDAARCPLYIKGGRNERDDKKT